MRTKLYTLLALAGTILCSQAEAKIWRLNNNGNGQLPLIVADFPTTTTLQQAHDNALVQSGDTLHLEQSPTSYGNCTFTKRLVVIGVGYFLPDNPKTQVNKDFVSTVGQLIIQNTGAAGTVITGLTSPNSWHVGASNVVIARNRFLSQVGVNLYLGTGTATNCDNISVYQNFFGGSPNTYCITVTGTGNFTNINIVGNLLTGRYGVSMSATSTGLLKNNTILVGNTPISVSNFYVVNNMAASTADLVASGFTNCVIEYNMGGNNNQFIAPAGTGNTFGPGNFTTAYSAANWGFVMGTSQDGYYQLNGAALGKTAGKNSEELGAYGGTIPYRLSGIPTVPNIYAMSIAPITPGASSISVTVSAKSNN